LARYTDDDKYKQYDDVQHYDDNYAADYDDSSRDTRNESAGRPDAYTPGNYSRTDDDNY
jgi:hypothetical protein